MLDGLEELGVETDPDAPRFEGVFTVAGARTVRGLRKLPGVFLSRAQLYADRRPEEMRERLRATVRTVVGAREKPTFLVTPCRAEDHYGLYARDVFTRSLYRTKLKRAGLEMATEPFVRMDAEGRFSNDEWGTFEPSFVITRDFLADDHRAIARTSPGLLAFTLATHHLGRMDAARLRTLTEIAGRLDPIGSTDVAAIAAAVKRNA